MGEVAAEPEMVRQVVAAVRKPLIRQVLLLAPLTAELLLRSAVGHLSWTSYAVWGLVLLMAATVTATVDAWRPLPRVVGIAVLVLDLVGLGLMRLVPEGNGLGLLVVLVAMWLGAELQLRGVLGSIRVDSQVGSGTTFLVRLPRGGPARAQGGSLSLIVDEAPGPIASRRPVASTASSGLATSWPGPRPV